MPNFIPSARPTSYHVLHMIFPKLMILRTTSPQPELLTFAKVISLAKHKASALSFSKIMDVAITFGLGYDMAMIMTLP